MNCNLRKYDCLDNSFDGVDTLNIPKTGTLSSCPGCTNCQYDHKPCGNTRYQICQPEFAYTRQNNDPLSCINYDFSCVDNIVYNKSLQPSLQENPQEDIALNNSFGLKYTPGFFPTNTACGTGFTTIFDPRLVRADGQKITLDRPPLWGQVPLDKIYDKQFQGYGKNYKGYRDINTGSIQYYFDKGDANAYFQPLYVIQSDVTHRIFKDPMDSLKVYYDKKPINETLRNVSDYQDTRDTLSFREDIMSKQSEKMNRNDWTRRWISPVQQNQK